MNTNSMYCADAKNCSCEMCNECCDNVNVSGCGNPMYNVFSWNSSRKCCYRPEQCAIDILHYYLTKGEAAELYVNNRQFLDFQKEVKNVYETKEHVFEIQQDLQNKIDSVAESYEWDDIKNKPSFATVATSGDYSDLNNKPKFKTINSESILGDGNIEIIANVDDHLDETSENPVQNKAITAEVGTIKGGSNKSIAALDAQDVALGQRVDSLEAAVGTDGSVDARIQGAVSAEAATRQARDEQLLTLYEALTQSYIVVVADHTEVSSPETNTIYREQGDTSYSDWMYYDGNWYKMATYNNAIDDKPTAGSDNLVKSGGVLLNLIESQSNVVNAALQSSENYILNSDNWVLGKGYINEQGVIGSLYYHIHIINKNIRYINLSGGTTGAAGAPYIIIKKNNEYSKVYRENSQQANVRGNYYVGDADEIYINIFLIEETIDTITFYPKFHHRELSSPVAAKELYINSTNYQYNLGMFYTGMDMPFVNSQAKYSKIITDCNYKYLIVGSKSDAVSIYFAIKRLTDGTLVNITNAFGLFDISDAVELYLNFLTDYDRQYLLLPKVPLEIDKGLNKTDIYYNSGNADLLYGYINNSFNYHPDYKFACLNVKNAKTISALYGNNPTVFALVGLKADGSLYPLGNKGCYNVEEYDYVFFNIFDDTYIQDVFVTYNEHIYNDVVLKPFDFSQKTALFVGDSITKGYVNASDIDTENAWPTLFASHFNLASFENRAVGGATIATVDGHGKIGHQVAGANQFDYLFIAGGTNDCTLNVSIETFKSSVNELLDSVLNYMEANQNMKTIWITPIDNALGYDNKDEFPNLQKYRNVITEEVTRRNNGRMSIIQGNKMPFPKVGDSYEYITTMYGDLLHPSATGYKNCYLHGLINALI